MTTFYVTGGKKLTGEVSVGGAKNAVLPLIAATLLTDEPVTISNVPAISDVPTMLEILSPFGVEHEFLDNGDLRISAANLHDAEPDYDKISEIRASVLILGPMLGRLGKARFSEPGGCKLGARSIDVHLKVFEALGAQIDFDGRRYDIHADGLVGKEIVLEELSFTGTENAIMAAVLAKGVTTFHLAAVEPEILNLIDSLKQMGAKIEGANTHTLTITGVEKLSGAHITVISDRIEASTLAIAAAITGGDVTIHNYPVHHLDIMNTKLRMAGVDIEVIDDHTVRVRGGESLKATSIRTDIYPGFPTDAQPLFAALMTKASGKSLIHETMYDSRFRYVAELVKLGAKIQTLDPHRIEVEGPQTLSGGQIACPDIRGGAGLLIAALGASGDTVLGFADLIERGYAGLPEKLTALGAEISKEAS